MKRFTMLAVIAAFMLAACTSEEATETAATEEDNNTVEYLFVQNGDSFEIDGTTLTLIDVDSRTLYFSDRPERIAGYMNLDELLRIGGEGENSFAVNPPNATFAVFDGDDVLESVIVLRNPRLVDDDLSFDFDIVQGDPPDRGGHCVLFIDTIGRPATPASVAGVHRRHKRRHRAAVRH